MVFQKFSCFKYFCVIPIYFPNKMLTSLRFSGMQRLSTIMREHVVCNSAQRREASQCPSAPMEFTFDGDYDSFVSAATAARTAVRRTQREVGLAQILATLARPAIYNGLHLENGEVLLQMGSRPIVRIRTAAASASTIVCIDLLDVWSRCGPAPSNLRRTSGRERQRGMLASRHLYAMLTSFAVSTALLFFLTYFILH